MKCSWCFLSHRTETFMTYITGGMTKCLLVEVYQSYRGTRYNLHAAVSANMRCHISEHSHFHSHPPEALK